MRNVCGRKHAMAEHSIRWWFCLLLVMGFTAGLAVDAVAAEYVRSGIPTDADLTVMQGRANTLVIRLLNLTPYSLTYDRGHTDALFSMDTNRKTHKSGMFAPVGWPGGTDLHGLQGDPTVGDQGWMQMEGTGNWLFVPANTNTSTHPYNFVVSWDDQGGYVDDSMMGWTIKGVYAGGHGLVTKDVPLRFWFTRINPNEALRTELFKKISAYIMEAVDFIGVLIDPVNPIAWIDFFVATDEMAKASFEYTQTSEDAGTGKMYFAAYAIPDDPFPGCKPSTISHSSSSQPTDAVDVQWASGTGNYSSEIIVTTEVLQNYNAPTVSVTLWTPEHYRVSRGLGAFRLTSHVLGQRLYALVDRRSRFIQFVDIYRSLNKAQHETLREAVEAFLHQHPLTHKQVDLVEKIIAAMQNGQTTLGPKPPKGGPKPPKGGPKHDD